MRTVLITGTSSGIGLKIAEDFLNQGMTVIGLSRTQSPIVHENFINQCINLSDYNTTEQLIKSLLKEHNISILVNNAGVGYYGLCEELNPSKIHEIISTNLEAPIVLSALLLRQFKKNNNKW